MHHHIRPGQHRAYRFLGRTGNLICLFKCGVAADRQFHVDECLGTAAAHTHFAHVQYTGYVRRARHVIRQAGWHFVEQTGDRSPPKLDADVHDNSGHTHGCHRIRLCEPGDAETVAQGYHHQARDDDRR
jgi:hypothetical protein